MYSECLENELCLLFRDEARKVEPLPEWWDRLISDVTAGKPRPRRLYFHPGRRLALAAAPLALLLIGGTVYGATSVIREMFFHNVAQIEMQGLSQEMDMSCTLGGVTVKLERVYADANGVIVGFSISGPQSSYYMGDVTLLTSGGQTLRGSMGLGAVPGTESVMGLWGASERNAMMYYFDALPIEGTPASLDLQLSVSVSDSAESGDTRRLTGPFVFDFNVPFHGGKIINIGQTAKPPE
jgi:hypothetical protein